MKYELAKELKAAGFSQSMYDHRGSHWVFHDEMWDGDPSDNSALAPTLTVLIEACGGNFYSLYKTRDPLPNEEWLCSGNTLPDSMEFGGSTPTEAVARLWLELRAQKVC